MSQSTTVSVRMDRDILNAIDERVYNLRLANERGSAVSRSSVISALLRDTIGTVNPVSKNMGMGR